MLFWSYGRIMMRGCARGVCVRGCVRGRVHGGVRVGQDKRKTIW